MRLIAKCEVIKDIPVSFSTEEILRYLKFQPGRSVLNKRIRLLILKCVKEARPLIKAKAALLDSDIKEIGKDAVILDRLRFNIKGFSIAMRFSGCEKVTLFAVTIGSGIEKKASLMLKEQKLAQSAVMDAVGSAVIESAVDYVEKITREKAEKNNLNITSRFSPGYGDWELKSQKNLLRLLKADKIGILLSSGFQMIPQKSVTGVIGWVKRSKERESNGKKYTGNT